MDIRRFLWDWIPNAQWDLFKYLAKRLGESGVLTMITGGVQKLRDGTLDWWVLGTIFLGSLLLMWWSSRPLQKREQRGFPSLSPTDTNDQLGSPISPQTPPQVSHRDAANREKIVVLVHAHARHAHTAAQLVTQKLFGQLDSSSDAKKQTIFLLLNTYVVHPCNSASADLYRAAGSSDEESIEGLRQRLWKFFDAYQKLVCWTNHLVHNFYVSPSGDSGYNAWQENHKLFYKKLEELIASDDFFQLPENLQGQWRDIDIEG